MRHSNSPLIFLFSVMMFPSVGNAELCRISNERVKLVSGSQMLIHNEECPDGDRRVVKISIQPGSKPPQTLIQRTQQLSDFPFGGAKFQDLENDGIPEVEFTGYCSAPNCEHNIFKLSKDEKSMYLYYQGAYFDIRRTTNYLVTSSYGSYSSWEYLAYDPSPKKYPLKNFRYSIYITSDNDSNELTCRISEPKRRKKLQLVDSPPHELLKFCHHYGDTVPVKIENLENIRSPHGKKYEP